MYGMIDHTEPWSNRITFSLIYAGIAWAIAATIHIYIIEPLWPQIHPRVGLWPFLLVPLVFLIALVYQIREQRHAVHSTLATKKDIREQLAKGIVEVARIRPLDVVEIEEANDEGPKVVYRLPENRAMIMRSGPTEPGDEDQPEHNEQYYRPNDDIELFRLPNDSLAFECTFHGKLMTPSMRLSWKVDKTGREHDEVFDLDWDAFCAGKITI